MCIRDRDQAAPADCDDQGLDVRSSIKHLERDGALTLDHREMVKGSDKDRAGVFDELSRGSERALEAVSYTHLDVYKRQVYSVSTAMSSRFVRSGVHPKGYLTSELIN